jgi:DNA-binding CsgD family transcriptional regulator
MDTMAKSIRYGIAFAGLTVLALLDIWLDFEQGIPIRHLLFETLIFLVALIGLNYFSIIVIRRYREQQTSVRTLQDDIGRKNAQLSQLNNKVKSYKEEFRLEIEATFKSWGLTRSEVEVAGLLLKGLSLKEIADLRASNERTVRSQCSSVYKKSKLDNRNQLSSYFLDDLI